MKTVIKKSVYIFLAVAILASSTGITVFKMVCGSSGKQVVSLLQINKCSKNKEEEKECVERKCCDFSTQTFKVNLLQKTEFKASSFASNASLLSTFLTHPRSEQHYILPVFCDSSPPKSGRQIICSNSAFLI